MSDLAAWLRFYRDLGIEDVYWSGGAPQAAAPEARVDAYVHQVKQQRESEMARLLKELNNQPGSPVLDCVEYRVHLVKGPPRKTIPAIAREVRADMVVMGTVARVGIPGFITGNTAEMILSQINSSVLAIKPEGFRTPVTLT